MGNIPLCISRQEGIVFGEFPEDGRFTVRSFRQLDGSTEDLRGSAGLLAEGEGRGRRWGRTLSWGWSSSKTL